MEEKMPDYLFVGKSVPRTIEADKVTGKAVYIDDLKRPGMLLRKNTLQQTCPCKNQEYRDF